MALWQARPTRTASGGRYKMFRKKRAREIGSDPTHTKVSETRAKQSLAGPSGTSSAWELTKKSVRTRGGHSFTRLLTTNKANLMVSPGKFKLSKIKTVKENPANRHFSRMNVLTKGAIVDTEDGLARITSKPARHGVVNAVLIGKTA